MPTSHNAHRWSCTQKTDQPVGGRSCAAAASCCPAAMRSCVVSSVRAGEGRLREPDHASPSLAAVAVMRSSSCFHSWSPLGLALVQKPVSSRLEGKADSRLKREGAGQPPRWSLEVTAVEKVDERQMPILDIMAAALACGLIWRVG